jgi:O2-independent ubiquinone biosynthesis accessory factor UbiT
VTTMKLPALPAPLTRLIGVLPAYPASFAFAAACNLAAWPSLRELDWTPVIGQRLCVRVQDLGVQVHFALAEDGFRAERPGPAAVTFSATAQDLARLALRLEDPDTLFFDRRLRIEGDTDLGLRVKNMLDGVDLDTAAAAMPMGLGSVLMTLRRWAVP